MKGLIFLNINAFACAGIAEVLNSTLNTYLIKYNKTVDYDPPKIVPAHCKAASIILENIGSVSVNYVSKNAKVSSWVEGDRATAPENFAATFVNSQASFSKDLAFKDNAKSLYENLSGRTAMVSYLTYNTKSSVILYGGEPAIRMRLIHTRGCTLLYWSTITEDQDDTYKELINFYESLDVEYIDSELDFFKGTLVLLPLYFVFRWRKWSNEDTTENNFQTADRFVDYLTSLVVS
jgi:hypothetical protein